MAKPRIVILHSGGLDSTALIDFYLQSKYTVSLVHISYDQPSKKQELLAVKKISKHYNVKFKKIILKSPLRVKDGFLMGRNLFFLSSVLTFSDLKKGEIALGIHYGTSYIDSDHRVAPVKPHAAAS